MSHPKKKPASIPLENFAKALEAIQLVIKKCERGDTKTSACLKTALESAETNLVDGIGNYKAEIARDSELFSAISSFAIIRTTEAAKAEAIVENLKP